MSKKSRPKKRSSPPPVGEEKYRQLAESVLDAIYEFDLGGVLTYSNQSALDMFGLTLEETIGKINVQNLIVKEDIPASRRDIELIMQGRTVVAERTFVRKNGVRFVGEVHSGAVMRDGKPVGVLGVIRDVTFRKKAEEELRESEETLRQIVELMPYPMEICDTHGLVKMVNRASLKMFGLSSACSLIDKFNMFDDPLLKKKGLLEKVRKAFDGEVVLIPEIRIGPDDLREALFPLKDSEKYFEITVFPVFRPPGTVWRVATIRKDITTRRKSEEEMIRTQKLESLGLLAGGIAHDFNNLLAALFGYLDLARMMIPSGDKPAEYLDKALAVFQRAKDLTRQLLTFAKGDVSIRKTVSIESVLKEAVNLCLSGTTIRCGLFIPDDLDPVMIDEGQMAQVFSNILINARQAMPAGGTVFVKAVNAELPGDEAAGLPKGRYVKISIEDHGVGIPEQHLSKIFDPFFTTKQEGSGLGLTISHSIVRKHGGNITVASRPGEGSTFSIFLPSSSRERIGGERPAEKSGPAEKSAGPAAGSILVMDDEESVRTAAGEILKFLGYSVSAASDGGQAVAMYRQRMGENRRFDAVILDLTVADGRGGIEAGREILAADPAAILVVSSGYSQDPVMSDPARFGFKAVIPKPYRLQEIHSVLERVLGKNP